MLIVCFTIGPKQKYELKENVLKNFRSRHVADLPYTVDTRYLDILETLQKMSRYPNVDINVDKGMLTNSVSV